MAMELGKNKIRVNSICPGLYQYEITEGLMRKKGLKQVISKLVPLRDFGTVDPALTSLVRYLICDTSDYVTGNIFIVDGGFTLASVPIYSSL
ncbi:putative NAD(P)-binding domain superfamily [Helianthus debilis subsp. tardiflorus]